MAIKSFIPLVLLVFASAMMSITGAQDISSLLTNHQLVKYEIGCVLRRNSCDFIGKQIKIVLPEALNNNCRRCTPQQAESARLLMGFMKENFPNEWRQIVQMYNKKRQRREALNMTF